MNAEVKRVYFKIDGEFLSNFARTRVIEGAWEQALKMLVNDCGTTHDQAIEIMRGHATFTGVAEIGNPDSHLGWKKLSKTGKIAKDVAKQLDYMYGHVFKYKDKYWKPYACVHGWQEEDMMFARSYTGQRNIVNGDMRASNRFPNGALRSLFYANSHEKDLLVILSNKSDEMTDVLCEQVNTPPFWLDIPLNDPAAHIRSFKGLSLPLRGAVNGRIENDPENVIASAPAPIEEQDDSPDGQAALARELTQQLIKDLDAATTTLQIRQIENEYEEKFKKLRTRNIPSEVWDWREEAHHKARANIEEMYAVRVRKQADELGGWYDLNLRDERHPNYEPASIKVPRNAFLHWALRGFRFEDFGRKNPEWPCIAGSGWKLPMDDPYHTDWMLGAGIPLSETYDRSTTLFDDDGDNKTESLAERVRSASFEARSQLVEEWTGVEFSILSKGKDEWFSGEVVFAKPDEDVPPGSIAIAPNAGPKYYMAMISANKKNKDGDRGLLICQTGGTLAHLAVVGREEKCTVLMIPKANAKFQPGDRLWINLKSNKITVRV